MFSVLPSEDGVENSPGRLEEFVVSHHEGEDGVIGAVLRIEEGPQLIVLQPCFQEGQEHLNHFLHTRVGLCTSHDWIPAQVVLFQEGPENEKTLCANFWTLVLDLIIAILFKSARNEGKTPRGSASNLI